MGANSVEQLKQSIVTDVALTQEEMTHLEELYACRFPSIEPQLVDRSSSTDMSKSLFAVTANEMERHRLNNKEPELCKKENTDARRTKTRDTASRSGGWVAQHCKKKPIV
ncbi:hypothetical protein JVT61DRAFT_12623 [Boletus reticuloceps]|uniref:Uncharacterized protein n=1 Tax=Boletus reticuloceps TaxID=495285 RepID=A0A8I2YDT2_9AGAM|nr:hypothetical protein JVT61DRAFT_12623 [Boletus reticuloceps]